MRRGQRFAKRLIFKIGSIHVDLTTHASVNPVIGSPPGPGLVGIGYQPDSNGLPKLVLQTAPMSCFFAAISASVVNMTTGCSPAGFLVMGSLTSAQTIPP
jgi:hypothetical protein